MHSTAEAPTVVYQFFDDTGKLLYVGITFSPASRFDTHRRYKPWWDEVSREVIEDFPNRHEAEERERQLIRDEDPRYNRRRYTFAENPRAGQAVIQVYLPEELKRRLSMQAAREQIPYAEIVKAAIETELTKRGG